MAGYKMKSWMKLWVIALLCLLLPFPLMAEEEGLQISLLTSSPYEGEVFTVYGHAALRVKDDAHKLDYVFNYGIFSFSQPHFIYRFAKGETDYMLGACRYSDYMIEYQMRGSSVTEQKLNLSPEESQRLWLALSVNYEPQNRTYRYNFFFDNCATRPVRLIEENVTGKIVYRWQPEEKTFRDMINYCTRNHPWLTFGCDLALGSPTDRVATAHEMMFLPEYMKEAIASAVIVDTEGNERPLVQQSIVVPADEEEDLPMEWLTPLFCAIIICIASLVLTFYEYRKRYAGRWHDILLFTLAGIGGLVLFFLSFISEHPCTCPNWNMLWLHPLQLSILPLSLVKNGRKAVFYYHFINFAAIMIMLLGWRFIPQHFNHAIIPLIITLGVRSASYILRFHQQEKRLK